MSLLISDPELRDKHVSLPSERASSCVSSQSLLFYVTHQRRPGDGQSSASKINTIVVLVRELGDLVSPQNGRSPDLELYFRHVIIDPGTVALFAPAHWLQNAILLHTTKPCRDKLVFHSFIFLSTA